MNNCDGAAEEKERAVGTVVAKEIAEGRASFLLHLEMVVHGHLLHSRQQAVVGIHYRAA